MPYGSFAGGGCSAIQKPICRSARASGLFLRTLPRDALASGRRDPGFGISPSALRDAHSGDARDRVRAGCRVSFWHSGRGGAAEAVKGPTSGRFESSSSFASALILLSISPIFSFSLRSRRSDAIWCTRSGRSGDASNASLSDVGGALGSHETELREMTAKRRPLPHGCARATSFHATAVPSRRRLSAGMQLRRPPRRSSDA